MSVQVQVGPGTLGPVECHYEDCAADRWRRGRGGAGGGRTVRVSRPAVGAVVRGGPLSHLRALVGSVSHGKVCVVSGTELSMNVDELFELKSARVPRADIRVATTSLDRWSLVASGQGPGTLAKKRVRLPWR